MIFHKGLTEPSAEGQTVVRRFIMLEKLTIMTAIAQKTAWRAVKLLWKRGDMIPF